MEVVCNPRLIDKPSSKDFFLYIVVYCWVLIDRIGAFGYLSNQGALTKYMMERLLMVQNYKGKYGKTETFLLTWTIASNILIHLCSK